MSVINIFVNKDCIQKELQPTAFINLTQKCRHHLEMVYSLVVILKSAPS